MPLFSGFREKRSKRKEEIKEMRALYLRNEHTSAHDLDALRDHEQREAAPATGYENVADYVYQQQAEHRSRKKYNPFARIAHAYHGMGSKRNVRRMQDRLQQQILDHQDAAQQVVETRSNGPSSRNMFAALRSGANLSSDRERDPMADHAFPSERRVNTPRQQRRQEREAEKAAKAKAKVKARYEARMKAVAKQAAKSPHAKQVLGSSDLDNDSIKEEGDDVKLPKWVVNVDRKNKMANFDDLVRGDTTHQRKRKRAPIFDSTREEMDAAPAATPTTTKRKKRKRDSIDEVAHTARVARRKKRAARQAATVTAPKGDSGIQEDGQDVQYPKWVIDVDKENKIATFDDLIKDNNGRKRKKRSY